MGCSSSRPSATKSGGEAESELHNYDPIQYESDQTDIRALLVTHVHFVAHSILQSGGNHWGLGLQTGPSEFVCLNMDPSEVLGAQAPNHGYRGRLYIRYRDDAVSDDQQTIVTIPANPGYSVGQLIDAIMNEGNHLYDFTTGGRDCTGWILDQCILFQQNVLIASGYNLAEAVVQQWESGDATKQIGVTRGTYMRDTTYGGWAGTGALRRR